MKKKKVVGVKDEVFEKCKKQAAKVMEDNITFPTEEEVSKAEDMPPIECKDCGKMVYAFEVTKCPDCGMRVCETCLAIHKDEHLAEMYEEEEEEEERTNKPQWR